jgi:hypothetical protein
MQRVKNNLKRWRARCAAAIFAGLSLGACDDEAAQGTSTELMFTAHLFREEAFAPFPSGRFTASGDGADITLSQTSNDPTLYEMTDNSGTHLVRFVPMHKTPFAGDRRDFIIIEERSVYNEETAQFTDEFIYRLLVVRGRRYRLEGDLAAFLAAGITLARCPEIMTDAKALHAAGAPLLEPENTPKNKSNSPGWFAGQSVDLFVSGFAGKMKSLFPGPEFERKDFPTADAYGAKCRQFAESTFVQRYGTPSALTAPSDLIKTERPGFEAALGDAITATRAVLGQDARVSVQFARWLSQTVGSAPTRTLAETLLSLRKSRASGWLKFSSTTDDPQPPFPAVCQDTIILSEREGEAADVARSANVQDLESALPLITNQCPHVRRLSILQDRNNDGPVAWLWRERDSWSAAWVNDIPSQD